MYPSSPFLPRGDETVDQVNLETPWPTIQPTPTPPDLFDDIHHSQKLTLPVHKPLDRLLTHQHEIDIQSLTSKRKFYSSTPARMIRLDNQLDTATSYTRPRRYSQTSDTTLPIFSPTSITAIMGSPPSPSKPSSPTQLRNAHMSSRRFSLPIKVPGQRDVPHRRSYSDSQPLTPESPAARPLVPSTQWVRKVRSKLVC